MSNRPKMAETFAKALRIGAQARGFRAYIPHWLLVSLGVGSLAAYHVPNALWSVQNWGVITTVFGGFLTFNGILLAVGWSAFSKVHEIIGNPDYASFMRRNDILDIHLMMIDLILMILTASAVVSGVGLVCSICDLPVWQNRCILAVSTGMSLYGLIQAKTASDMMHDLIWERSEEKRSASQLRAVQ